jgi:molybdate transport system permease protein
LDWQAFRLSLLLGLGTALVLIPAGLLLARVLAWRRFPGRSLVQGVVALPLVLPPTVLGYYLLVAFGPGGFPGSIYEGLFGQPLVFTFEGLLLASIIINLPFAIQPMQRGFESIPQSLREAAWCSGLSAWRTFLNVELSLAWPGILAAIVLTFAHTLGEFGVVLMVGGSIQGETRTISISIYDRVQAFDNASAGLMSAVLLGLSFAAIAFIYMLNERLGKDRVW